MPLIFFPYKKIKNCEIRSHSMSEKQLQKIFFENQISMSFYHYCINYVLKNKFYITS